MFGTSDPDAYEVSDWRIGEIELPDSVVLAIDLAGGGAEFDGLFGSDVLSNFGSVTVDYEDEVLRLEGNA